MEEFDCKKCLHEKVCALWASRESQNASCFCTDGCDYFTPTLTQPNEPLTLEELREMDGEPVWVVYDQDAAKTTPGFDPLTLWALVEVTKDSVFLTNNLGGRTAYADDQDLAWAGITVYRRPPEGEEYT